jgi:hypothetical protein
MSLEILGSYVERFSYGHVSAEEALRRIDEEITAQLRLHADRADRALSPDPP